MKDGSSLAVASPAFRATDQISISDDPSIKRKDSALVKAQRLLAERCKQGRVALFSHPSADPDAIGSMMGMAWLIKKAYDAEVDCFYDGQVSHPQNQRMCNLLDPDLKLNTTCKPEEYSLRICVDTIPNHAATVTPTDFDLVIDHHKDAPNGSFRGVYVNLKAGSCCATVYQLIKQHGLTFEEDNDADSKVATALMTGIITDTEFQTSDDTTELEHDAYRELFEHRNPTALKQIIRYKQPKEWVQARTEAAKEAHDRIKDGILVHGIGFITAGNRDLISAVADEMLSWENVETSVAFAVVDGKRIEGSVRSGNAAIAVPQLCKELGGDFGGDYGGGGGKMNKGAYFYSLGSCSEDDEMDEETKGKLWEFINDREQKRLMKTIKK